MKVYEEGGLSLVVYEGLWGRGTSWVDWIFWLLFLPFCSYFFDSWNCNVFLWVQFM